VALARALELAPDNLNALATHLDLSLHRLDWLSAISDANRMQKINPGSAVVLHEMYRYYQHLGFPDLALASARAAAQIDPLSVVDRLNIVAALLHVARYSDAASVAEEALSVHYDQPFIQSMLCTAYAHTGRIPKSQTIVKALVARGDASDADGCRFDIAMSSGRPGEARAIMDKAAGDYAKGDWSATDIGDNYAIARDYDKAIVWLSRSYDNREFSLFTIPFDKAIPPDFFKQPGWIALWDRPLARDWQAAHDVVVGQLSGT
jgi:tetratricopeptide (TPR) repeat protein